MAREFTSARSAGLLPLAVAAIVATAVLPVRLPAQNKTRPPNIVFILADDK